MANLGGIILANIPTEHGDAVLDQYGVVNNGGLGSVGAAMPSSKKKRGNKDREAPPTQILTIETVRVLMNSAEGVLQIIQTLKENGCTMPDQKVAEILQFVVNYIDIVPRGPNIPQLPKKELSMVMEYVFPNLHADVRQRPGKGFKAVVKSLLRCLGCSESVVQGFSGNQRFWRHVAWNDEGRNKVSEALQWRAGGMPNPHLDADVDEDDEEKKMSGLKMQAGPSSMMLTKPKAINRPSKSVFIPKYDVLFSRTTWHYYIRVFLPMCDPATIQQGIKLDLLRGQLAVKSRYTPTTTLPPWCTGNEAVSDLEIVQPLPPSACGEFNIDIPLPFDVDRVARKEVHVTDIGVVVSLKRLKEELTPMEFKVHGFAAGPTNPPTVLPNTMPSMPAPPSVPAPRGMAAQGGRAGGMMMHHSVPMPYQ